MSGWILLIIGLACLALVLAFLAWVGLKGWRTARHGMAVSRSTGSLAGEVAAKAAGLEVNVGQLQANADQLQVNLVRLRASAERLRILSEAINEALGPYRSVRSFFGL